MKTKISKILGVGLTVVLLSSLLVFAVPTPVSAGTLAWTPVPIPQLATNQLVAAAVEIGPVVIAPDGTMYAGAYVAAGSVVYRSPNGGYSWIPTASALGAAGDYIVDLEVANNGDVIVATQRPVGGAGTGIVYRSTNGGASFGQLGVVTLAGTEVITCLSVAPNYDGVGIIAVGVSESGVGVTAAVAQMVQVWGDLGVLNWASASLLAPAVADVVALQFSTNFNADNALLAVTAFAAADPQLRFISGGAWTWDTLVAATAVGPAAITTLDFATQGAGGLADLYYADIALPADYRGTLPAYRHAYVSLVSEVAADCNVYRIDNVVPGVATNPGVVLGDIDFAGNYNASDSLIMGGLVVLAGAVQFDVYYCSNSATPLPLWYPSTNAPSGVSVGNFPPALGNQYSMTHIYMADDFLTSGMVAAGTVGNDDAFAITLDKGNFWNERGLIDNAGVAITFPTTGATPNIFNADIAIAPGNPNTMFMVSTNLSGAATTTNLWRTTTGGVGGWDRVFTDNFAAPGGAFTTAGIGVIAISETYATDGIVYLGDIGSVDVYYSGSGGSGWEYRPITGTIATTIADMYAQGNTLYVADAVGGTVAKSVNGSWTWPLNLAIATGTGSNLRSIAVDGTTIVVGDANGNVYRSANAGVNWAIVGVTIAAGEQVYVAVHGDNVYAMTSTTASVSRWTIGISPVWYPVSVAGTWPLATTVLPTLAQALKVTADNTLYALDPTAATGTAIGPNNIARTITPEFGPYAPVAFFEWMAGMAATTVGVTMDVTADTNGNFVALLTGTALWVYGDTVSAGATPPVLLGPAEAATLDGSNVANLMVENAFGVTNYNFWISNDPNFLNNLNVANNQAPPATMATVALGAAAPVTVERPVYWMARATAPLRGPWSESRSIIPQPVAAPNAPGLLAVALDASGRASITPVLSWGAFRNATGYQVQIAEGGTEIDFSTPLIDETLGATTSYVVDTALAYDTAYAFRVRGLVSGGSTDWSASFGFKTEKAAVGAFICPLDGLTFATQAELEAHNAAAHVPTTPMYIWIVIGIGAILVIAVIWLIFSTRRA